MDKCVLDWIENSLRKDLSGDDGQKFLTMLRDNPNIVAMWIRQNLDDWLIWALDDELNKTGALPELVIINDFDRAVTEVVNHLRRCFDPEIQALPTAPVSVPSVSA